MSRKIVVSTDKAPKAIGPYSQAIRVGNFLFCSGQIPLDPASMEIRAAGVEEQTEQVLKNLTAVLASQELTLDHIVKTTVFLKNMSEFPKFNAVYEKYFKSPFPARSTVEVAALPKGALVEIEGVACFDNA